MKEAMPVSSEEEDGAGIASVMSWGWANYSTSTKHAQ